MLHLSTNEYPWGTFYGRDGRDFGKELDAGYGEVAASGLNGIEPFGSSFMLAPGPRCRTPLALMLR